MDGSVKRLGVRAHGCPWNRESICSRVDEQNETWMVRTRRQVGLMKEESERGRRTIERGADSLDRGPAVAV